MLKVGTLRDHCLESLYILKYKPCSYITTFDRDYNHLNPLYIHISYCLYKS